MGHIDLDNLANWEYYIWNLYLSINISHALENRKRKKKNKLNRGNTLNLNWTAAIFVYIRSIWSELDVFVYRATGEYGGNPAENNWNFFGNDFCIWTACNYMRMFLNVS